MMKARSHVAARIPPHEAHPTTVWELLCLVPSNRRKKMKRADTEAYSTPRKIRVGIMNEKETFLYNSFPSEPNAGAVLYWFPVYAYTTEPTQPNTKISQIVTAHNALGKSLGLRISAMKEGSVIWPMKVYEIFKNAFMPATNVTPFTGSAVTMGAPPWMPVTGSTKFGSGL